MDAGGDGDGGGDGGGGDTAGGQRQSTVPRPGRPRTYRKRLP